MRSWYVQSPNRNNQPVEEQDIKADMANVVEITNHVLKNLQEYLNEHPTSLVDLLMGIHSAHKVVVLDIAHKWSNEKLGQEHVLRMSDMTFRKAMRELKRDL